MPLSAKDLWKRVLDGARRELPDTTWQSWLAPNEAISYDPPTLVNAAPDDFV